MFSTHPIVSIIIATKNEEKGIGQVISSIPVKFMPPTEVIVADSSTDATPEIARKLGARVIHVTKPGKGSAMRSAAEVSRGQILVFMDGDCSDPPSHIPRLLNALDHADIVLGARCLSAKEKSDPGEKMFFIIYLTVVSTLFKSAGLKFKGDPLAGFRAMKKSTFKSLNLTCNDFRIEAEMNVKAAEKHLKIQEIPIPILKRSGGLLNSKLATNPRQCIKIATYVLNAAKKSRVKWQL